MKNILKEIEKEYDKRLKNLSVYQNAEWEAEKSFIARELHRQLIKELFLKLL
jgi:hypothetical protein